MKIDGIKDRLVVATSHLMPGDVILTRGADKESLQIGFGTVGYQAGVHRASAEQLNLVWNQYSLMVQSWESLIGRRQTVNNLYLTGNATILAAIGVFIGSSKDVGAKPSLYGAIILSVLGALLSLNWLQTIVSYGTLSQAKSKVVLALEQFLPAKLFDTEWAVLEAKKYRSTTRSDKQASQFFILLFALMFVIVVAMNTGSLAAPEIERDSASTLSKKILETETKPAVTPTTAPQPSPGM